MSKRWFRADLYVPQDGDVIIDANYVSLNTGNRFIVVDRPGIPQPEGDVVITYLGKHALPTFAASDDGVFWYNYTNRDGFFDYGQTWDEFVLDNGITEIVAVYRREI